MCAVGVKVNGVKEDRFIIKIILNKAIEITVWYFPAFLFEIWLVSVEIIFVILLPNSSTFDIIVAIVAMNRIGIKVAIQFIFKVELAGSKDENKFVITIILGFFELKDFSILNVVFLLF